MDNNSVIKDLEYAKDLLQDRPQQSIVDYELWAVLDNVIGTLRAQSKPGKWEKPEDEGAASFDERNYVQCSLCKKKSYLGRNDAYCRNCGARMETEDEEYDLPRADYKRIILRE